MKLNKEDLNKYRRVINEALKDVEQTHSIKLPKEILDELFFGSVKEGRMRSFEYSFDAIENLDLSDYSFEDVSFNSDIPINLSNINAKIDFHKSFTYKMGRNFRLKNIDFTGTDLSESNIIGVTDIENCSLKDTGIVWPKELFNAINTDFTNTDMSSIEVPLTALTRFNHADEQKFTNCKFTNTGLNLSVKNKERLKYSYPHGAKDVLKERNQVCRHLIENGYIVGCKLNGVLIQDKEAYQAIANENKREYEHFKSEKIDKTLRLIKKQNSSGGKMNC